MPQRRPRKRLQPLTLEEIAAQVAASALRSQHREEAIELDTGRLQLAAACQGSAPTAAAALPRTAARLLCTLLTHPPLTGIEPFCYLGHVLNALVEKNGHFVAWEEDEDDFHEIVDRILAGDASAEQAMSTWFSNAILNDSDDVEWHRVAVNPSLRAFILAPMTGLSAAQAAHIRQVTGRLAQTLRGLGFAVHAPAARPASHRADSTVMNEDMEELQRADLLIVVSEPPAIGVGMLLAFSDRTQALVLVIGPEGGEVSPIANQFVDRSELAACGTLGDAATAVSDFVTHHRAELEAHARAAQERTAEIQALFNALRARWQICSTRHEWDGPLQRSRVDQIIATVEAFASATYWEIESIRDWLDAHPVTVDPNHHASGPQQTTGAGGTGSNLEHPVVLGGLPGDDAATAGVGQPSELSEERTAHEVAALEFQYALFPAEPAVRVPPHLAIPGDFSGKAWLTPDEQDAALDAAFELQLTIAETKRMLRAASERRCQESLTAVGARSRLTLDNVRDWTAYRAHFMDQR